MTKEEKSKEVFSGTSWEAGLIQSLLSNAEIKSFLRNDLLNSQIYDPIYSVGSKVMVMESDYEMAKDIVREYKEKK